MNYCCIVLKKMGIGDEKRLVFDFNYSDCLTKWVKQFRLGNAINKCFALPEASKQ
jgi:hypothetical protein